MARDELLDAALNELWERGYAAAGLTAILNRCGLTKGGLYHHFDSKEALAQAVLIERVNKKLDPYGMKALQRSRDPLKDLSRSLRKLCAKVPEPWASWGSPIAAICSGAPSSVVVSGAKTYESWKDEIRSALERGKRRGTVNRSVNCEHLANSLIVTIEGGLQIMRTTKTNAPFVLSLRGMGDFLESLRPA